MSQTSSPYARASIFSEALQIAPAPEAVQQVRLGGQHPCTPTLTMSTVLVPSVSSSCSDRNRAARLEGWLARAPSPLQHSSRPLPHKERLLYARLSSHSCPTPRQKGLLGGPAEKGQEAGKKDWGRDASFQALPQVPTFRPEPRLLPASQQWHPPQDSSLSQASHECLRPMGDIFHRHCNTAQGQDSLLKCSTYPS